MVYPSCLFLNHSHLVCRLTLITSCIHISTREACESFTLTLLLSTLPLITPYTVPVEEQRALNSKDTPTAQSFQSLRKNPNRIITGFQQSISTSLKTWLILDHLITEAIQYRFFLPWWITHSVNYCMWAPNTPELYLTLLWGPQALLSHRPVRTKASPKHQLSSHATSSSFVLPAAVKQTQKHLVCTEACWKNSKKGTAIWSDPLFFWTNTSLAYLLLLKAVAM